MVGVQPVEEEGGDGLDILGADAARDVQGVTNGPLDCKKEERRKKFMVLLSKQERQTSKI